MNNKIDYLSNEKISSFVAGLSGLSKDELKKAKLLFIRNAIIEYNTEKQTYNRMLFIPVIGWLSYLLNLPFQSIIFANMKAKIRNAIDIWKEDLAGESFVIDHEKIQL